MGQALYRKYRPTTFKEAVGQEAVIKTLSEAISSGRISHAYLFSGSRGVGKTSIARILAHEVNQLPYDPEAVHLDIIEIDAASNRRIDEIRDLREKVHITPASAKYKVYIIDEVHMLTKEAFNALLKTLEEPPAHCIFILATTEPHKLPETIISRTQRFNFKPISKASAKAQLQNIVKSEKITIDEAALDLLAEYGDGSLRDIISALDQLNASSSQITTEDIHRLLGMPSEKSLETILSAISEGDAKAILSAAEAMSDQGSNPANVAKAIGHQLRRMIIDQNISQPWINTLLKELLNVAVSTSPQEALELALLDAAALNKSTDTQKQVAVKKAEPTLKSSKPSAKAAKIEPMKKVADFKIDHWSELLDRIRSEAPSLYTALRLSRPTVEGGKLNLVFPFSLHQKKVKEAKHLQLIARMITEISGASIVINCIVDRDLPVESSFVKSPERPSAAELTAISNIFGSAEVLES